jgi:hypothetical protein
VRVPLFKERPTLRPPAVTLRRVLVICAPTKADVPTVRAVARRLRPLGVEVLAASECHGEVRGEHRECLFPNGLLIDAAEREWDAVIIAGGRGALRVAEDPLARQIVSRAGPVVAIGLGRAVLERAGAEGFSSEDPDAIVAWLCERLRIGRRAADSAASSELNQPA